MKSSRKTISSLGARKEEEEEPKIYTFKELSPEAKNQAIEDARDDPKFTWDDGDSQMLTESFEQDIDDHYGLGDDMKVFWSLSYSQGDGVCFEGPVDVGKFIETETMKKRFGLVVDKISVKITHHGHY